MKVKIKMNVPKPPTGMPGVTFFGSCYKWNDVFYRMGEEYTVNKADFNPAIMVSLEPPKKTKPLKKGPTIIHPVVEEQEVEVEVEADEEVELDTSDEVPIETPKKRAQKLIPCKQEISGVERRKKK